MPNSEDNKAEALTMVGAGLPMLSTPLLALLGPWGPRRSDSSVAREAHQTAELTYYSPMFSSTDAKFVVLAFSSLFSVINPIEAAPIFVTLTAGRPEERRRMAFRASAAAALILALFALTGGAIFGFFGITLPAFQIAGGILFTIMGLTTLRSDDRPDRADSTPTEDPSIVPLGMPLIAGPGAISTVMVLVGQARDGGHRAALAIAIGANILLTLVILLAAPTIVTRIGQTGQRIVSKIMGLIVAVIGVQFILNGVETVALAILRAPRN